MVRVGVAGVLFLTGCIGSLDGACVVRMGEFAYAHPSKYCKVHDVVGQVSGCTIEWIRIQSGMEGVKMLEERNLDIATIGSTPTTLAISPPLSLDVPPRRRRHRRRRHCSSLLLPLLRVHARTRPYTFTNE